MPPAVSMLHGAKLTEAEARHRFIPRPGEPHVIKLPDVNAGPDIVYSGMMWGLKTTQAAAVANKTGVKNLWVSVPAINKDADTLSISQPSPSSPKTCTTTKMGQNMEDPSEKK